MRSVRIAYCSQQAIEPEPPKPVERPAGDRSRPPLPEPPPEKLKPPLPPRKTPQPRLPRRPPHPKMLKRQLPPSPGFSRAGPPATEHHETTGVPEEHAGGPAPPLPHP